MMLAGITPVAAVDDNAKLITIPLFLKVFSIHELTQ
jgi:hypothetical protein